MRPKALLSWSSGKDGAFALHVARRTGSVEVVGLVTTVSETDERVAVHGVRRDVLRAQADAVGLPLTEVALPTPCPNEIYEARMDAALAPLRAEEVRDVVFGDIHLADIRAYREAQLARIGMRGRFPLWGKDTGALARDMLRAGIVARVAALDSGKLPVKLAGSLYDEAFLAALPDGVDPCGEGGEFHTVVSDGPVFSRPVPLALGEVVERNGYAYADFLLATGSGE